MGRFSEREDKEGKGKKKEEKRRKGGKEEKGERETKIKNDFVAKILGSFSNWQGWGAG